MGFPTRIAFRYTRASAFAHATGSRAIAPARAQPRCSIATWRYSSRHQARALTLLVAAVTGLWNATGEASPRLELWTRAVQCADADRLPERVERLLGDGTTYGDLLEVFLEQLSVGLLRVRLTSAGRSYERELPFTTADCPGLPYAVASIIRGWLRPSWATLAESVADMPEARPQRAAPVQGLPSGDRPSERPPGRWRISAGIGGHASLGGAPNGLSVTATAEWDAAESWGAVLLGSVDALPQTPFGSGLLGIRVWQVAALARLGMVRVAGARVDLLAGPAGQMIGLESTSYPLRGPPITHPGAAVMVRWRQQVLGPLAFAITVGASSRFRADTFKSADLRGNFTLPAERISAVVGLTWTLQ